MTTHTPGPWQVIRHKYDIYANGKRVAHIPNLRPNGKRQASDHEEEQANARLIAAAPELLDALKALFEHCAMVHKHWGEGSNQRQADEAIAAAIAVIQKAEGE